MLEVGFAYLGSTWAEDIFDNLPLSPAWIHCISQASASFREDQVDYWTASRASRYCVVLVEVEVKYCCNTVISSAMWGFIIRDDSVGDVPVIEGNPDKAAVFARFEAGDGLSVNDPSTWSGRLVGLATLARGWTASFWVSIDRAATS